VIARTVARTVAPVAGMLEVIVDVAPPEVLRTSVRKGLEVELSVEGPRFVVTQVRVVAPAL
jgi:hypothetical protein